MYEGDEVDLLYVLLPHGWSEVLLYVGGDVVRLGASHVFSDPTVDLIRLAISLRERASTVELVLWGEPGGHLLRFEQLPDRHDMYAVRVGSFPKGPPQPPSHTETTLVHFTVKADHFAKLVFGEMEKAARLLEDKTYRENRKFPYAEFKRLRGHFSK